MSDQTTRGREAEGSHAIRVAERSDRQVTDPDVLAEGAAVAAAQIGTGRRSISSARSHR